MTYERRTEFCQNKRDTGQKTCRSQWKPPTWARSQTGAHLPFIILSCHTLVVRHTNRLHTHWVIVCFLDTRILHSDQNIYRMQILFSSGWQKLHLRYTSCCLDGTTRCQKSLSYLSSPFPLQSVTKLVLGACSLPLENIDEMTTAAEILVTHLPELGSGFLFLHPAVSH